MSLLKLNDDDETTILIDMRIRETENNAEDVYDVASHFRMQLKQDDDGRPYVDVFFLSHNDDDHIKGLQNHFHLGSPDDYKESEEEEEPKIVIKEMWSSSRFWKRESDNNKLCDDAKAFNREMKRRVRLFEENETTQSEGDRALIICKDPEGKTDDIEDIVRDLDTTFSTVNERDFSGKLEIEVLGPLPKQENEADDDFDEKNRGSVILLLKVIQGSYENKILLPGDAEVFVWECLHEKFKHNIYSLEYDILLAPHHCSWHSLSYDSWSQSDDPKVSDQAKKALSQAKEGAFIVSSSKPIKEGDDDPPSYAAKKEYLTIVNKEHFLCTGEYPKENDVEPITIKLTSDGPQLKSPKSKSRYSSVLGASTSEPFSHG